MNSKEDCHCPCCGSKLKYWDRKMVLKILQNKVYLGIVENAKNKVTEIGGKHFKRVPDEERICVSGMHTPVITEEEFLKASRAIKERGAQKGKNTVLTTGVC